MTFIAPHFWTFTKIGKTGRCSVENYCGKTMTRASALDLCGTFLGCVRRVWVCSMVSVSKSAVTRAPTIALHETGTSTLAWLWYRTGFCREFLRWVVGARSNWHKVGKQPRANQQPTSSRLRVSYQPGPSNEQELITLKARWLQRGRSVCLV